MMHPTLLRGGAVSLREILPKARFLRGNDVVARSCSADWKACRPGDIFFALTTADGDGHECAAKAIERGAVAVVAERLLPVESPQVLVRDSRAAFARVCQALAGHPSRELKTIGVTGSAGKTVTSILVASVLEAAGQAVGVMSSLGHSDSIVQRPSAGTSTAAEFASWMRRMTTAGCEAAVLELPSRSLAERQAAGIELDAAVLTNMFGGDLDEHNSSSAYQKIQRRIFKLLKPGGLAVLNGDDHRCRALLRAVSSPCLTYALHAEGDVTASVLERSAAEQMFLLSAGSNCVPVRTRMIGDHHISNCLAAAAVSLGLGIDLDAIVRGLEAVERVPGRLERLECGQAFGVFVDAAASPQTLALAIKAVRQVTRGRVLVVFGTDSAAGASRRALLGRVLERTSHVAMLTSGSPGESEPLTGIHELLDGFSRPHKAHVIPNRAAAIRFALAQARPGDCVLIAGSSSDVSNRERRPHDDREIACQWLYERGEPQDTGPRFRVVG
jgi:UDP-N-acetylmuramoyl-L-alanyl-D-glutamate--2,6-diaminopimelate ligase